MTLAIVEEICSISDLRKKASTPARHASFSQSSCGKHDNRQIPPVRHAAYAQHQLETADSRQVVIDNYGIIMIVPLKNFPGVRSAGTSINFNPFGTQNFLHQSGDGRVVFDV
jgi:hypothetical protein